MGERMKEGEGIIVAFRVHWRLLYGILEITGDHRIETTVITSRHTVFPVTLH